MRNRRSGAHSTEPGRSSGPYPGRDPTHVRTPLAFSRTPCCGATAQPVGARREPRFRLPSWASPALGAVCRPHPRLAVTPCPLTTTPRRHRAGYLLGLRTCRQAGLSLLVPGGSRRVTPDSHGGDARARPLTRTRPGLSWARADDRGKGQEGQGRHSREGTAGGKARRRRAQGWRAEGSAGRRRGRRDGGLGPAEPGPSASHIESRLCPELGHHSATRRWASQ